MSQGAGQELVTAAGRVVVIAGLAWLAAGLSCRREEPVRLVDPERVVAPPEPLWRGVQPLAIEEPPVRSETRLGLTLQTLSPVLARNLALPPQIRGAVVSQVAPGSIAAKSGLASGDVVTSIDGNPVRSAEEAMARLHTTRPTVMAVTNSKGVRTVRLAGSQHAGAPL